MELNQISVNKTGKSQKKYRIKLNNFEINFDKSIPKFQKYDTIKEEKKLKLFSNFYLPISLGISTYYEIEEKNEVFSKEEAKEKLVEKLKSELSEETKDLGEVVNIEVNSKEENEYVEVEVIYEVLESIGTEEKIL